MKRKSSKKPLPSREQIEILRYYAQHGSPYHRSMARGYLNANDESVAARADRRRMR